MAADDFFRVQRAALIELRHRQALLVTRRPWSAIR
jgi:hypothetical protein